MMQLIWLLIGLIVVVLTPDAASWVCEAGEDNCLPLGTSVYLRISFSLALFHILVLLIIAARTKLVAQFYDGCWGFKWALVAAIFAGSYFIDDNPFFDPGYMSFAAIASLGFLAFTALYMLVFAVLVNERIVKNAEVDNSSCSTIIAFALLILSTAANVTWLVMMFLNFGTECTSNLVMLCITAVAYVIMHAVVFMNFRADASVLTSALVSLYAIFLQWSALSANEDAVCNPYLGSHGNATARLVISMMVAFMAIFTAAGGVEDDTPAATIESEDGAAIDDETKNASINESLIPSKDGNADGAQASAPAAVSSSNE